MRFRPLLTIAPLAFLVLVGAIASRPPAASTAADLTSGRDIFRHDTFGDEQLWTGALRMHEAVATLAPKTALAVGLKVDLEALPAKTVAAIKAGQVDLTSPAVTLDLLRANAIVGVRGTISESGTLTSVGVTCALCHSTVDDALVPGIGKRLDGWANTSLDVGAILALSPALDAAAKAEFKTWGPGKYDPRHHYFDGTKIVALNATSVPIDIPAIYGLKGVGFETVTGDGPISYWNAYVGIGQMGGKGTFRDARLKVSIDQSPDLVTPKLKALLDYQLSLDAPKPPASSVDGAAASRGRQVFEGKATCARCHQGPTRTDVGTGATPVLHDPAEVGADAGYAARSASKRYRATPLRGLFQHAPYFHDGSAKDLAAVVARYEQRLRLSLTAAERRDLVEYLKSL
jgi:mono/diheme cytochrome c family protein